MHFISSRCIRGIPAVIKTSRVSLRTRGHTRHISRPTCCVQQLYGANQCRNVMTEPSEQDADIAGVSHEAQGRATELRGRLAAAYPRVVKKENYLSVKAFRSSYDRLLNNETSETDSVTLRGRIMSVRFAGNMLLFLDLKQDDSKVQVLCNFRTLALAKWTLEQFKDFSHYVKRGDIYSFTGLAHRTSRGELTLKATELPTLLSPCLHDYPDNQPSLQEREFLSRHVELLTVSKASDILRFRSFIIQNMRQFFLNNSFLDVQTPILASSAGGATARPFITSATDSPCRPLALRIAPELWLKRLIVGGIDRIFELGPSFRNEGLDKTHNPEFTTCEFYASFFSLSDLITLTQSLLRTLQSSILDLRRSSSDAFPTISPPSTPFPSTFPILPFIPTIEKSLNASLPSLHTPATQADLLTFFHAHSLPVPSSNPTVPRLLDKLSSLIIEPLCDPHTPTFITHHPSALSPLAKSYPCPHTNHQLISPRAELFLNGHELANMYEEENSPFEQRRKFRDQVRYRREASPSSPSSSSSSNFGHRVTTTTATTTTKDDGGGGEATGEKNPEPTDEIVDESYLRALEWGLPPTGGWGCGVDRLVMVLAGVERIGEVLSFGNLRAVTRRHV